MSKSYTPGLKVTRNTKVSKIRLLPMKGTIVAKLNSVTKYEDVVASTKIPGNVHMINPCYICSNQKRAIEACVAGTKTLEKPMTASEARIFCEKQIKKN